MSKQTADFNKIDAALEVYYNNCGRYDYRDNNGVGKFISYIISEQLDDPELPIEDELGDGCAPRDCAYDFDPSFPVPNGVAIPNQYMEEYFFYILQYCHKYNQPPTDQYIVANILAQETIDEIPPVFTKMATYELKQEFNSFGNDEQGQNEGIFAIKRVYKIEFKPKYPARAHLNIFTSKEIIKKLLNMIEEQFDDELHAYYYTDLSAALQMNDHQIQEFMVLINNEQHKFGIINYDFHVKEKEEILYGVFVPNDDSKIQQDKWLWKLDEFLTAQQISNKYGVASSELPASSRKIDIFQQQLHHKVVIDEKLIDDTDWFGIKQIKSLKRNINTPKLTMTFTKTMWVQGCKKSFQDSDLPLIPIVVNENNKHWIEWIKIIHIKSQNVYVGISCKYYEKNNEWKIQSIYLDRDDIYNKHQLVGLMDNKYMWKLKHFKTTITEIIFSDDGAHNIDKKMNILKQQITSQRNSTERLKESLIRVKNGDDDDDDDKCMEDEIALSQSVDDKSVFAAFIDDDEELKNQQLNRKNGAKEKIYISGEMTIKIIRSRVNIKLDAKTLYKYMDSTIHSPSFKEFNTGQIRIIHYGFIDKETNNILYCIADLQNAKKNKGYKWKMRDALFTENEIEENFCISKHNLPPSSRSKPLFVDQLKDEDVVRNLIKNQYEQIIKKSDWHKIPIFNKKINKKRRTLTIRKPEFRKELNEFIANNKDNIIIIPVLMSDGDGHRGYHIEYVQIVKIDGDSMGISYIYNPQKHNIVVTGIYLNKELIQERHALILLQHNDICQCLNSFISDIDCLVIGEVNKENNQLKYYKDRCEKLTKFTKNSARHLEKIASNPTNIINGNISQWIQTAQQIITNDKNVDVNVDLSSLYSADQCADNSALTQLLHHVAQLNEINNFYFQQTLNPNPQTIIPHPMHQQMPQNYEHNMSHFQNSNY